MEEIMTKLRRYEIFNQPDLSDDHYNQLVFGLKPASSIFQLTIETCLFGIDGFRKKKLTPSSIT